MSASKEKKNRVELRSEGSDKKVNAAAEQVQKEKKFRRNAIIATVIVVLVIAAAIVINSNLFYTKTTAVQVGGTRYSAAEVNCFYRIAFNNVYANLSESYGDYVSLFLDTSSPLSEQQYSEDQTWADYIYQTALSNMEQVTVLCDEAKKNGFVLTDADQAEIDSQLSIMRYYASYYGYENLDGFLSANYGKGMTEKLYSEILTKMVTADAYSEMIANSFSYSDDELKSYYAENADALDYFSYYYYFVSTSNAAFEDVAEDAKADAAHEAAAKLAEAADGEAFAALAAETFDVAAPTEQFLPGNSLSTVYGDWLRDAARTENETTVIDTASGSYAVMYTGRDDNNYNLVSMRHILISAEADENGEYTDEAMAAAQARIEEINAEWQLDPTEDNLASLAELYSEDTGSNTAGGLYEEIYKHSMVPEINDFLFADGRAAGDSEIIPVISTNYAGCHLVYFVGEGEVYCDYLADSLLRQTDYNDYLNDVSESYDTTTGFGLKFVDMD